MQRITNNDYNDNDLQSEDHQKKASSFWMDKSASPEEAWADSCLEFNNKNAWRDINEELLDALARKDSSSVQQSDDGLSSPPIREDKHVSPASQERSSFCEPLTPNSLAHNDIDEEDFSYEKTDDESRILYKGEEYILLADSVPDANDDDDDDDLITKISNISLGDVESLENIFKVWDLETSKEDEEDELTLELRKALQGNHLQTSRIPKSYDNPISTLNTQELDDVVQGFIDLSITD